MLRSVGFVLRPYSKPATPLVRTAGVAVGRRRLHGSYTTAGTAAALWFQPVVSETVARSLKAAGFLGVADRLSRSERMWEITSSRCYLASYVSRSLPASADGALLVADFVLKSANCINATDSAGVCRTRDDGWHRSTSSDPSSSNGISISRQTQR